MKSILLSIKPEWLAKILNGEKTIEVRKKFPKDYVGWVYLYCSKDKKFPLVLSSDGESFQEYCNAKYYPPFIRGDVLNGKVVARFWCNKVEEIKQLMCGNFYHKKICLTTHQLNEYIGSKGGFAIHISKLEIFDEPKKLNEFHTVNKIGIPQYQFGKGTCDYKKLTKAPQNYCYIEGE